MNNEAIRKITLHGNPFDLSGNPVAVGDVAPDFTAVTEDLGEFKFSAIKQGKVTILSAVPSLDTPVCDVETRRFNKEAADLDNDIQIVTVSVDLPFAQKRWCGAAGVDKVTVVSDHKSVAFGNAYGVMIEPLRLLARAVFVVGKDGKIVFSQIVPEVVDEPDYAAVLDAAKTAAK
ncbi:MAG: thiol peroxidase [Lentisphaerae bacterium]|nr:thiol peroxidase [Lentisphaerota bacterium]